MREIIGQMTIAELVQNRDKFAQESIKAAMSDMGNMGLEIINLTIQNFSDKDNNVIETMALQNIVDKERDAKIARQGGAGRAQGRDRGAGDYCGAEQGA